MNIVYVEYSIAQKSLDIFISGCNNNCKDCCNPEIKDFNAGKNWELFKEDIIRYLNNYGSLINNIFLVGGSPNHQKEEELKPFFAFLKEVTDKPIWLFAGEELETVQDIFKDNCEYIKVGAYVPSLKVDNYYQEGIKIATSNQRILKKGIDY